jgi:hypothetical protein
MFWLQVELEEISVKWRQIDTQKVIVEKLVRKDRAVAIDF